MEVGPTTTKKQIWVVFTLTSFSSLYWGKDEHNMLPDTGESIDFLQLWVCALANLHTCKIQWRFRRKMPSSISEGRNKQERSDQPQLTPKLCLLELLWLCWAQSTRWSLLQVDVLTSGGLQCIQATGTHWLTCSFRFSKGYHTLCGDLLWIQVWLLAHRLTTASSEI